MTADDAATLGDRLIRVESEDAGLRRRYEEGTLALRERRLTPGQKALAWVGVPLDFALAAAMAYHLWAGPAEPPGWSALLAVAAAGLTAIGAWTLHVLLHGGRVPWRADRAFQALAVAAGLGLAAAAFQVARSLDDRRAALGMLAVAFVVAAGTGTGLAVEWMKRLRLEARIAALENELRLAELSRDVAALGRDRGDGRPRSDASPPPA